MFVISLYLAQKYPMSEATLSGSKRKPLTPRVTASTAPPTRLASIATPQAMALQAAAKAASEGRAPSDRILDAAVVPAFVIGLLVGMGQGLE